MSKHPNNMKRLVVIATLFGILAPAMVPALAFDPNYIISDAEMTDEFSMDLNDIQRYLDRGYLSTYKTVDIDGKTRSATEIIWRASQNYQLSPKFILGMLQREQSLVEDDSPSQTQLDWAMGYAVCDVCLMSDSGIQRWRGFAKQVNSASAQFREGYLADLEVNGKTSAGLAPGKETTIDSISVTPANNATAALYSYTPHLHGNQNLATIWDNYFTQDYPSGSLLQAKGDDVTYLIQYGVRRPITSKTALLSRFNPDDIIQVDASTILKYAEGPAIAFPNYSLLQSPKGTIYLIVDDTRRGIDSIETFNSIGFSTDELIAVTNDDLAAYSEGTPITAESIYPQGHLLQNKTSGGVYFVEDGIKHPLISKTLLDLNYKGWRIHPVDSETLDTYTTGDKVLLPDGTLVKSTDESAVYIISEGKRRPITSGEVFEAMGWKWENIIVTDQKMLELQPIGDPIDPPTISALSTANL